MDHDRHDAVRSTGTKGTVVIVVALPSRVGAQIEPDLGLGTDFCVSHTSSALVDWATSRWVTTIVVVVMVLPTLRCPHTRTDVKVSAELHPLDRRIDLRQHRYVKVVLSRGSSVIVIFALAESNAPVS